ncbi:zinc finger, C2H2 type [Trichinella nativa]|uniref:Zinc finger, C2H2 type n=1 Tax=Trichinella nativa TaxID=6335 RepID=A0A1Y3EM27_9BILA|nr:zinc finger, C2H2 type [Trichinella nativa]
MFRCNFCSAKGLLLLKASQAGQIRKDTGNSILDRIGTHCGNFGEQATDKSGSSYFVCSKCCAEFYSFNSFLEHELVCENEWPVLIPNEEFQHQQQQQTLMRPEDNNGLEGSTRAAGSMMRVSDFFVEQQQMRNCSMSNKIEQNHHHLLADPPNSAVEMNHELVQSTTTTTTTTTMDTTTADTTPYNLFQMYSLLMNLYQQQIQQNQLISFLMQRIVGENGMPSCFPPSLTPNLVYGKDFKELYQQGCVSPLLGSSASSVNELSVSGKQHQHQPGTTFGSEANLANFTCQPAQSVKSSLLTSTTNSMPSAKGIDWKSPNGAQRRPKRCLSCPPEPAKQYRKLSDGNTNGNVCSEAGSVSSNASYGASPAGTIERLATSHSTLPETTDFSARPELQPNTKNMFGNLPTHHHHLQPFYQAVNAFDSGGVAPDMMPLNATVGGVADNSNTMLNSVIGTADVDDDWESLMEITTTDESEKIRKLVGEGSDNVTDPNQCVICRRVLSCKSALQMHYRTHTGERPFKCKICQRAFTTKGNLKTHMGVHRTKPAYRVCHQCPECDKKFANAAVLQQHMRSHVNSNNAAGRYESFDSKLSMFNYDGRYFPMPFQNLPNPENNPTVPVTLANSTRQPTGIVPSSTTSDSSSVPQGSPNAFSPLAVFNMRSKFFPTTFIGIQSQTPPIAATPQFSGRPSTTCNICFKSFACQSALEIHYRSHTKERPFKCQICSRGFSTKGNMKQHLMTHKMRPLSTTSSLDTTSTSSLNGFLNFEMADLVKSPTVMMETQPLEADEMMLNADEKQQVNGEMNAPTPLESIQRMWSQAETLAASNTTTPSAVAQSKKQTVFSKHQCQLCCKHFSSASALQIHMRIHTGDRPFKCNICERSFTTKGNLKVHMGTHMWNTNNQRGRRLFDGSLTQLPDATSPPMVQNHTGVSGICQSFGGNSDKDEGILAASAGEPLLCDEISQQLLQQHHDNERMATDEQQYPVVMQSSSSSQLLNMAAKLELNPMAVGVATVPSITVPNEYICGGTGGGLACSSVFVPGNAASVGSSGSITNGHITSASDRLSFMLGNNNNNNSSWPSKCSVCLQMCSSNVELDAHMRFHIMHPDATGLVVGGGGGGGPRATAAVAEEEIHKRRAN